MRIFTSSIAGKYKDIPVDSDCMDALGSGIQCKPTGQQQAQVDRPITEIELRQAILQGAAKKSPGDDTSLEFYRGGWAVIKTEMLTMYKVMFQE